MLIKYSRKNDRTPIGVLVAGKNLASDNVVIGWAACSPGDIFRKSHGLRIASIRKHLGKSNVQIPYHLKKILPDFMVRCSKYFKVDVNSLTIAGRVDGDIVVNGEMVKSF